MNAHVKDVRIDKLADREYYIYGVSTIEDRAIAGTLDGLKPVTRRALWAAHKSGVHSRSKHIKSAKVVGNVIGDYHPHGDTAAYDAIVTAANSVQPMIDGKGNWGTPLDAAAAYRYCFSGDTRVMTERGLLSFSELCGMSNTPLEERAETPFRIKVASKDSPQYTSHVVNSGYQKTVKVTSKQGYSVECTANEPFLVLTANGFVWKDANELDRHDWLCLKRDNGLSKAGTNEYKGIKVTKKLAALLGYLIGDGYINRGQNYIGFNQVSKEAFDDFVDCWTAVFGAGFSTCIKQPNSYGKQEYHSFYSADMSQRRFLDMIGLHEGDSYDRIVPACIWHCDRETVAAFLRALYECDGSVVRTNRSSSHVNLHSVSNQLLSEVSLLLRNYFGIFCSPIISEKKDGNGLRVSFFGTENLTRFVKDIDFVSEREIVINLNGRSNGDSIPYANMLEISSGIEYDKTQRLTFRRKYLQGKFSKNKRLATLRRIFSRDYFFDKVASVKKASKQYVYDLCVPATHSFVANGFVVHNTNLRLSHYSDNVFFDPFYLNAIETVPNFDGSNVEPVNLPALLPNLLINGNFGIATGVRASVPSFTVASLLKVIKIGLSREITAKDCAKHLVLTSLNGAKVNVDDPDNAELIDLYKTGKGKARFSCAVVERKDGSLRFNELPPVGILGAIDKIATLPAVALVTDDSDLEDVYPLSYRVVLKKGTTGQAKELTISKIKAILSCVVHFDTKITDRKMGEEDAVEAKLRSATIPQILNEWIKYRLTLESSACKFHMEKLDGKIARIDLLRAVIANLDFVIKLLKSKLDDEQITAKLSVKLKVSKELASEVLDFRLRQLKSLEDGKLVKQRKELVTEKKTLNVRRVKPGEYVGTTLKSLEAMAEKNFMTRLTQVRERLKSAKAKNKSKE